jgi:2-polyprenyl-3-methyl-5-hydroxy-6-metoxy-1,4-benzoquinol methylase
MRNTLERLVPALLRCNETTGDNTLKLHLDRYKFAARHARRATRILDLGCGVGYGSRLLKDNNPQATVVGIDISQDAVDYAARHYGHGNVSFVRSDAMTFADDPFDVVVSLETIEHVSEPEKFVAHISRKLLRPDGTFVGSVPITPSVDANPYHTTDFTSASFRRLLLANHLKEFCELKQTQPFTPLLVLFRSEERTKDLRENMWKYYLTHPEKLFLRVRSTILDGFCNKYLTVACRRMI